MLKNIQFSIPLWPGLTPQEIETQVYPVLEECRDIIADIYFTCRIPPFTQDAMGGVFVGNEERVALRNAMVVGERMGIPVSATFNDICVSPSYENYCVFIESLLPLYENGLRIVTIPHTSWLRFGLKKELPELFVKNTILNKVNTASEAANLFKEGFDYINLDRTLMRDRRSLREIHEAKRVMEDRLERKLYLSLLYNEMCEGNCPIQQEHFTYNLNRNISQMAFFKSPMASIAPCKMKNEHSVLWTLKSASIPSYYTHLEYLSEFVDVFKMHGRESRVRFFETLKIVQQFHRRELIIDPFREVLSHAPAEDRKEWLKVIQTCRFNCWKCDACERLAEKIKL